MRIVKPISITDSVLLSSTVPETDQPVYSSTTGYNLKDKVMVTTNVHKIFEVKKQEISTVTFATNNTTTVTFAKHGLANGRMVKFSSTGSMPTGVTAGNTYYVVNAQQDTFAISSTSGGSAISPTSTGTATITATALVNNLDPVTNPTYWLESGSTNKFKMFDVKVQSQTTATGSISTKTGFSGYVDTVALLNLTGASATVQVAHGGDGVVYNKTVQLIEDETPVVDLLTYITTGFVQKTEAVFDDIPAFVNTEVSVTVAGANNATVGIGAALFGQAKDISSTGLGVEQGAKFGIDDYSIKTRDAFGNYVITERAFSDRANVTVYVNNSELSEIKNFLTRLRATPVLFIGSKKHDYLTIYGYYKNWEVDVAYPDFSVLSMEVAGLT